MTEYLQKRYLNDVNYERNTNKSLQRSTSQISLIESPPLTITSLVDKKNLFNITLDILTFRKNAIQMCNQLLHTISTEISPFFNSQEEAAKYIHSVENHWTIQKENLMSYMDYELHKLKDKYVTPNCNNAEEEEFNDIHYNVDEPMAQQSSTDDEMMEIPSSLLQEMKAHLETEAKSPKKMTNRLSLKRRQTATTTRSEVSSVLIDLNQCADLLQNIKNLKQTNINEIRDKADASKTDNDDERSIDFSTSTIVNNNVEIETKTPKKAGGKLVLDNLEALDEVPDEDSLSSVNISLNVSSNGSIIIPKPSVLRITYEDSQENKHIMSKHYVQTDECFVKIPMREKRLVDQFLRRKRKASLLSRDKNESDTTSTSSSDIPRRPSRSRKRTKIISSSSSASSSASSSSSSLWEDEYSHDDYNSGTDSASDLYDNNGYHSNDSSNSDKNSFDEIPDGSSDSSTDTNSNSDDSNSSGGKNKVRNKENKKNNYERKPRPDWMNDPLLKPLKFNVDGSTTEEEPIKNESDSEPEAPKRIKLSLKKRVRNVLSTDDEEEYFVNAQPPQSSFDDEDSDVEFVSSISRVINTGEETVKKGRRNIKDIISEGELNVETQAVQVEERERIERLQAKHSQLSSSQSSTDSDFILNSNEENLEYITVHPRLAHKLLPHQRKGVQFLWDNCYEGVERLQQGDKGAGCILAHCMGLGKTLQVVTLVLTLYKYPVTNTKRVLVICPLSTMDNWRAEFKDAIKLVCNNKPYITVYDAGSAKDNTSSRIADIQRWHRLGGVMIIGYQSFLAFARREEADIDKCLLDPGPDLCVCDEGHLLKSSSSMRTRIISRVTTKRRIIMTGTPMQNNLDEYYCMVGFVKPNFLGTAQEYRNRFVNPINNGQFENSTRDDIHRMKKRSHVLHKMTMHFIQRFEESELSPYLPKKYDYAIKIEICDVQIKLLKKFLAICNYQKLFANVFVMRAICTHPYLLKIQAQALLKKGQIRNKKSKKELNEAEEMLKLLNEIDPDWWKEDLPPDAQTNMAYGPKLMVMMDIIKETLTRNEKLLIFSVSLIELDIIEKYLKSSNPRWVYGSTYYRMDGGVSITERTKYCNRFNSPTSGIKLMLLTHKVGGLGLNLFAANRAILMDTSWNPADDTQSVFRIYRLGQKKTCYVYRLIAMGTTEEVIYERSVTKQAISGRVVDEMQIERHFNSSDLDAMYRCKLDKTAERPLPKLPQDAVLANLLQQHQCIHSYQDHKELLQNLPHEELNDSDMELAWEEFEREKNFVPTQYPIGPQQEQQETPNNNPITITDQVVDHMYCQTVLASTSTSTTPPQPQVDALKSKTVLFESPTTKGGKVLAYFHNGNIENDIIADNITPKQVESAKNLATGVSTSEYFNSKFYLIKRCGTLVDLQREINANGNSTPYRPNIPRQNKTQHKPNIPNQARVDLQPIFKRPQISESINLIDDQDLELIE